VNPAGKSIRRHRSVFGQLYRRLLTRRVNRRSPCPFISAKIGTPATPQLPDLGEIAPFDAGAKHFLANPLGSFPRGWIAMSMSLEWRISPLACEPKR